MMPSKAMGAKVWFLVAALAMLSACSTVTGMFSSNENTDYNALTYGEDYQGAASSAHKSWSDPADRRAAAEAKASARGAEAQDSNYYTKNEKQDPTDDRVREQIETGRGLAVERFARGDRATRTDFYDNMPNDGSLWSKEDESNYFFTKGKTHSSGDIISVKMEEPMIKQVAEEIKKSLTPAEQEVEMALYRKNNALAKEDKDISDYRNIASDDLRNSEAEGVKDKMVKAVRWSQVDLSPSLGMAANEEVRAEVIDRYNNGNYKVRAVKRVLYRGSSRLVSLVAIAPAADFDEKETIPSGKLYEYKIKVAR